MAQVVKLKRTAVQGKVPTTSNLELGELAINTFDGRLFFEKNDGSPSIQQIVSTNSETSGSIYITNAVTSSYVKVTNDLLVEGDATINGDLTLGGNIFIGDNPSDSVTVSAEFSGSLIPDGNDYFDLGGAAKYWRKGYIREIFTTNIQTTSITGSIAATNGVVSGSTQITSVITDEYISASAEASGFGGADYLVLTNIPSGIVSQSAQLDGFVSASGGFTANEIIISDGTNSVISTDILTIDTSNNRIGVGTNTPEVTLDLIGEDSGEGSIRITQHEASSGGDASDLRFRKSRGTNSSPTAVQSGDALFAINSDNYNGTSYSRLVHIGGYSTGTDEVEVQFKTRGNGDSSPTTKLLISSSGEISGSFVGDGSKLTGVTSYTDSDNTDHLNSLGVISGSTQVVSSLSNQDVDLGTGDLTATTGSFGRVSGDNFGDDDGGSTFTGSFSGDGSNLTNIDVAQIATVTGSFSNAS